MELKYSFLGEHHVLQYCSNSEDETWWKGESKPCENGKEGGFKCACTDSGYLKDIKLVSPIILFRCNLDEKTAGYKDFNILKIVLIIALVILIISLPCCCCCCCCYFLCCRKKKQMGVVHQTGQTQQPWLHVEGEVLPKDGQRDNRNNKRARVRPGKKKMAAAPLICILVVFGITKAIIDALGDGPDDDSAVTDDYDY